MLHTERQHYQMLVMICLETSAAEAAQQLADLLNKHSTLFQLLTSQQESLTTVKAKVKSMQRLACDSTHSSVCMKASMKKSKLINATNRHSTAHEQLPVDG